MSSLSLVYMIEADTKTRKTLRDPMKREHARVCEGTEVPREA